MSIGWFQVIQYFKLFDFLGVSRFYGIVEWNGTVEWNSGNYGGMVECNDQLFMSRGTTLLYYEPASTVVAIR